MSSQDRGTRELGIGDWKGTRGGVRRRVGRAVRVGWQESRFFRRMGFRRHGMSDQSELGVESSRAARPVLTDRDRQLIGYLAIARYLSITQVGRLAFPGRLGKSQRRRLLRLAGEWKGDAASRQQQPNFDPPFLRRRVFRTFEGQWTEVWALTEPGYLVADRVLGGGVRIPRDDVSAEFLEHDVTLNEVLVGLIDPAGKSCQECGRGPLTWVRETGMSKPSVERFMLRCSGAGGCRETFGGRLPRTEDLPFRWTTSDNARLPWTEYDRESGRVLDRVIRPDAVLEIGNPRRRLFLECEMGTHTISPESDGKPGATLAKTTRYHRFIHGLKDVEAQRSFYRAAYPDGLAAEVWYLVPTTGRRDSVNGALQHWQREDPLHRGRLRARALSGFYARVIGPIKQARRAARLSSSQVPEYPEYAHEVGALLERLASRSRGADAPAPRAPGISLRSGRTPTFASNEALCSLDVGAAGGGLRRDGDGGTP